MILWYYMHSLNFILPLFDITIYIQLPKFKCKLFSQSFSAIVWGHVTQGVRQGRHLSALRWESNKWTTGSQGHPENMTAFSNFSVIVPMGQGVMDRSPTWAVCTYLYHFNMNHNPRHEFYFEAAYLLHNMFNLQNYLALSVSALSTANNLTVSMFCCLATAGCFARGGFGSVPNGQDP